MTNKRFTYGKCIDGFYDIIDIEKNHTYPIGNMEILVMGIVELLNELSEENEQLRFDFKEMKGLLHSLEDENEQLKQNARRLHSELMMRRGY